ncbi:MAG: hypothetical protein ABSH36_00045 [Solirubrobacteraceae bacterium]
MLALLAVFVFGGVATAVAQAESAPRWTVEEGGVKKILGKNETRLITIKADTPLVLEVPNAQTKITCKEAKVASGAILIGSEAGEPGTSETINEFSNCEVKGNGSECRKVKEPIVTKSTRAELVLSAAKTTFLVEFKPKEGEEFTTIKFEGAVCLEKNVQIRGGVVGSIYTDPELTGKEAELVSSSSTDLLSSWLIKFPDAAEKVWLVKGGTGKEETAPTLKYGANAATLEGSVLILLKSGGIFGAEVA